MNCPYLLKIRSEIDGPINIDRFRVFSRSLHDRPVSVVLTVHGPPVLTVKGSLRILEDLCFAKISEFLVNIKTTKPNDDCSGK